MKAFSAILFTCLTFGSVLSGSETLDRARRMLTAGDSLAAKTLLAEAAQRSPNDITALTEYAEFLDRYGDPAASAAYTRLLDAIGPNGDAARRESVTRRLIALDLLAGDQVSGKRRFEAYQAAGGRGGLVAPGSGNATADAQDAAKLTIAIPGPLRSFGRMAAISSDLRSDEVLGALARNVVTNGYQASHSNDALEQTEYLKLVHRYLSQARELEKLAGDAKVITVDTCESATAGELLKIVGYRMRGGCGSEVVLETVNASRAFLTTDSGFPLSELEQALRTNRPFTFDYHPTLVTVLFGQDYWLTAKEKGAGDFIDAFLGDPSLCRLYLGFSKLDKETSDALRKTMPVARIKAYAHVLDFFGGMFEIRGGKAIVPGGQRSAAAWAEVIGASPDNGGAFFEKLLGRDDGWAASLFDALARVNGPAKDYLTDPARIKRFYAAVKGKVTSPGPARPVFRSNADMMLLTTRLQIDAGGKVRIPGSIEVWRNLFINHPHGKYDGKLTKSATGWKEPDDVLEALFALTRKAVENEPLKIFMAISDLDRRRQTPLAAATVDRMAREYRTYGAQYAIFNDAPTLTDKTVNQFFDTAASIDKIRDPLLKSDTAGTMQALVGLWQIFCRQGSLPAAQADAALSGILSGFGGAGNRGDRELFDAGRAGVKLLLTATGSSGDPATAQDRLVDLLAGAESAVDTESHSALVAEMNRVLLAQRILPLTVLFELADHLESLTKGEKLNTALVNRLASRVAEIQLPRSALTGVEKNAYAFGYWTERHIEQQRKLNMRAVIERAGGDAEKLKSARGELTPFLRDTLVALNYAHYAPPGAQILYTNPLFARGHDFLGAQGANHTWRGTEMFGTGWPSSGGGRLVGSLSGLPYALAEAEQNFLIPSQTQALIWGDLVPQMILSAKIPRWWNVTPAQMHWLGLHMRYAESLLAEAVIDPAVREQVLEVLSFQAPPARTRLVGLLLEQGNVPAAVERVTPSELFVLARDMVARQKDGAGIFAAEIRRLAAESPDQVNYKAISRAFGTPKPTLANSYQPELLNLRTFPTLMGYSSRIMAESWESNTLYWAALADEMHLPPSQLNVLIPEWTQRVVERIFASHLEDWPALLKSLRVVGDDIRSKARTQLAAERKLD
jgi:hypothetical protein